MELAKLLFYCTLTALIYASKCSETCERPLQHEQAVAAAADAAAVASKRQALSSLWGLYFDGLKNAKYIELSHVLKPDVPIWEGFGHPQQFQPAKHPATGEIYRWASVRVGIEFYKSSHKHKGKSFEPFTSTISDRAHAVLACARYCCSYNQSGLAATARSYSGANVLLTLQHHQPA
jgi:hypothetical protein